MDKAASSVYNWPSGLSDLEVWTSSAIRACDTYMKKFELSTSGGKYPIHSMSILLGEDLLTCLWGGIKPHIGAIALALPRPSIADPTINSSTASVLTVLGHKEDSVVKAVAERLSSRLNKNVVVTAGIHWDHLDETAIREIEENCALLADMIGGQVEREA